MVDFGFHDNDGTKQEFANCGFDEFRCDTLRCMSNDKMCDGRDDCEDKSDEFGCPTESSSLPLFEKSTPVTGSGCRPNEFACETGQCLSMEKRCDGIDDCIDTSDEIECPTTTVLTSTLVSCYANEFECDLDRCLPENKRCDGHEDCSDKSDEAGCPTSSELLTPTILSCETNQWMCRDGSCIPKEYRCDIRQIVQILLMKKAVQMLATLVS
ncbi:very low-density lipoprotein receptor-like [Palaemon carinicauda]|uniref:very low-density lipoprotein receptor-like n=1 Tax=Palaemon carinicauda TaxID=392227 RepID=UPI0035B5C373